MQGIRRFRPLSDGGVRLELSATTNSPLAIDVEESTESRIQRLITENPVVIFSRSSCCMCHAMKQLLSAIGVHPTVIELDDDEIAALPAAPDGGNGGAPVVFIGGSRVGGLENLVALHLSEKLGSKLEEAGVLQVAS